MTQLFVGLAPGLELSKHLGDDAGLPARWLRLAADVHLGRVGHGLDSGVVLLLELLETSLVKGEPIPFGTEIGLHLDSLELPLLLRNVEPVHDLSVGPFESGDKGVARHCGQAD